MYNKIIYTKVLWTCSKREKDTIINIKNCNNQWLTDIYKCTQDITVLRSCFLLLIICKRIYKDYITSAQVVKEEQCSIIKEEVLINYLKCLMLTCFQLFKESTYYQFSSIVSEYN